ncbi:MAG TPA: cobyric acid synthase, partial [Amaricoccus sp.]|nr:cobyric acid synthase [Amaricoccus sp.]
LIEGAGSASETNLRPNDIANMGFAQATRTPVVLIGDIDRGGVIASLVGTKTVLPPEDAALIKGFIVNRFRGDPALFAEGMATIARLTHWRPLGLVPHFPAAARLPAEDALALTPTVPTGAPIRIAVPILPRIANFDDLDPLAADPAVTLLRTWPGTPLPPADLILLPGSKSTIADLRALRDAGFDIDIAAHQRQGRRVLGLCAGYQMLGREIADPLGIEGPPGQTPGLGHLDVTTEMTREKRLTPVEGATPDGHPFRGYEMHMGVTTGPDTARPFATLADGRPDGATSPDGLVQGTYVHGLFADDAQRSAWLARLGGAPSTLAYEAEVEATLDALARHLEAHLDLDALLTMAPG